MVLAASSTHRFWRAALVAALIPSWFQSGTAEPVTTPPSFPDDNYAPLTTSRPEAPLKADVHVCSGFDEQWDVCPGLPTCFPCSPVDCTFANWGEWFSAGGCTGIRFRQRGVKVSNSECGRPCDGPKIESERHILARCMNSEHDCSFSAWSAWTKCASTLDQSTRSRSIAQLNSPDGQSCMGSTKMTRACGRGPQPIACSFSAWHAWSECSATCGEGRRTRSRRIDVEAKSGGEPCLGATTATETCTLLPCKATGCQVSAWTDWGGCQESDAVGAETGHLQQFRHRRIISAPGPGGSPCPPGLQETAGCPRPQAQDCFISGWSLWSACDKICGGGQKMRRRELKEPSSSGGSCGNHSLESIQPCNTGPCATSEPSDCALSSWSDWSDCPARCGEGSKKRSRKVLQQASAEGKACEGPLQELAPCLLQHCNMVDCRWADWAEWSDCSCECGGGTKRRSRAVAEAPRNGGARCLPQAMEEAFPCNTQLCGVGCVDGRWSAWGAWTSCSATCSSSFRSRSRNLDVQPSSCGSPASGPRDQYDVCSHLPPCLEDVDCALAPWGDWSHCSCHCFGIRERNRYITVFATGKGKPCASTPLKMIEPCNPGIGESPREECEGKPAVDCILNSWEEWSKCSKSCNSGQRERRRTVHTHAKYGGRLCDGDLTVLEPCNLQACQEEHCTDCVWSAWNDWGGCSKCGGQKYRHRSIVQMPNHCGRPCNVQAAKETTKCHSECKKSLYCSWTEWSGATSCSACGPATTMRNRALGFSTDPTAEFLFEGSGDSQCAGSQLNVSDCPNEGKSCTAACVPEHCSFGDWSDWHAPTCVGLCERERNIAKMNNECGTPCQGPLLETKTCPVECMQPKDCAFSNWGDWSECPLLDRNAQRTRSRSIVEQPDNGGKACVGAIEETVACQFNSHKTDCSFSAWSDWQTCSRSCGNGWKERNRLLQTEAADGGLQCEGGLSDIQSCIHGPEVCPGDVKVDCSFGPWEPFTPCDENQQKKRMRKIEQLARNDGANCEGVLQDTESCHIRRIDCVVSEWSEWDRCDKSCGGGQSLRERQVHRYPQNGGQSCPSSVKETRGCNTGPCDAHDCSVSSWGAWGPCSASCGSGQQSRGRQIMSMRTSEGKGCDFGLGQTRECAGDHFCGKLDCQWGSWSEWSGCSCSCDGGQQTRTRHIARAPHNGGAPCEAGDKEQIQPCNTQTCGEAACRDGRWGGWDKWAPCSVSCGGGVTFRRRRVIDMANHCGKEPEGMNREVAFCQVGVECAAPVDCKFTEWGSWSACSSSCNGVRHHTRRVAIYGKGSGAWCNGGLKETLPCNPDPDQPTPEACQSGKMVDCEFGSWGAWTSCSATCGGGEHTRSRNIDRDDKNGGVPCQGSLHGIKECARHECAGPQPVDCKFGAWEDWGACGKCSGERKRFRNIISYAEEGGKNCDLFIAEEADKCLRFCHEKQYCGWAAWHSWDSCSASCGAGRRQRRRHLQLSGEKSVQLLDDIVTEYDALYKRTQDLEAFHLHELLTAFSAGGACLMLLAGALRTWGCRQETLGERSSRTLSRAPGFFSRRLAAAEVDLNGDYLLVGGEHETELPWAPRVHHDETDEEG